VLIPLRGGRQCLALAWQFQEIWERHDDLNRTLEQCFAGLLKVLAESWPDWPVEIWGSLVDRGLAEDEEEPDQGFSPRWWLEYRVSFGGEGPEQKDVAAMVAFVSQGLASVLGADPEVSWGSVDPDWRALWVVDDAEVYRLLAAEWTDEASVFLIGHYAGQPTLFAATLEAWPLKHARLGIRTAEADLGWAFAY
jgi:hypothetical protein